MQTRNEVESLHYCREFCQPLECLYQAMQTQGKKFSNAFIKYFSKLIRQMKSNSVYLLLGPKRFSQYTLQTIIFPTNQSKRASDNARTNEISRYKSQIKVQICGNRHRARERRVNESDISFESSQIFGKNAYSSVKTEEIFKRFTIL